MRYAPAPRFTFAMTKNRTMRAMEAASGKDIRALLSPLIAELGVEGTATRLNIPKRTLYSWIVLLDGKLERDTRVSFEGWETGPPRSAQA